MHTGRMLRIDEGRHRTDASRCQGVTWTASKPPELRERLGTKSATQHSEVTRADSLTSDIYPPEPLDKKLFKLPSLPPQFVALSYGCPGK